MITRRRTRALFCALAPAIAASCNEAPPPQLPPPPSSVAPAANEGPVATAPPTYSGVTREDFNRAAVRLNLPLYWVADKDSDLAVDPDEVKSLLFYPSEGRWVKNGAFTQDFADAFAKVRDGSALAASSLPAPEAERRRLVLEDLDQGVPTLVATDMRGASEEEKKFVRHMLTVAGQIDDLFATQIGAKALASHVAQDDVASQSLFRRNWGPRCLAPKTEKNPQCSAIAGAPKPICDAYPAPLQSDPKFCEKLEKLPNAKALLAPFVAVRGGGNGNGALEPASLTDVYKEAMTSVSSELRAAADDIADPKEAPLKAYLSAAATSFTTNDWLPADEAWSKMNAQNSRFYLRVAPDEVYWEPCNHKAGFHLMFARINQGSLRWQEKLLPVQQDMEKTLAARIGAPYKARAVTFHLPDFVDIVVNAGDDRTALGATIGQSLPNWGPVSAQGRGRTIAMSNLYTDADSVKMRRSQAASLLDAASLEAYSDSPEPGLLATILHEATHNLGPAHEYAFHGKTDAQAFGGQMATMLEELKAQTGALWYIDFAKDRSLLSPELARQTYADCIVWAFGHISRGMYTEAGARKAYSQLSAIEVGFLIDEGALTFDANALGANGTDKGVFTIHFDKLPAATDKLMKLVGQIKATNDRAAAEALAKKYVDGTVVPHKLITERELRYPRQNFVYSVDM